MFFSIIVPVFQAEKYIDRCVKSVLRQKEDFEVILIDDGSADRSLNKCKLWAKQDRRVRIYSQKNHGVSYTRNEGLKYSKGEYILFLDSDDELPVNTLSIYKKIIELNQEPDIIIGGYRTVLCRKELNSFETCFTENVVNVKDNDLCEYFWPLFDKNLLHNIGTKIYKRQILYDNFIQFNSNISIYEDVLFCLKAIKVSQKVSVIKDIVYIYNIQSNMLSLNHIYRRGIYVGMCELFDTISTLPIKKDEKYYSFLCASLIETLYNEFRITIFCYRKIKKIVCLYKDNMFIKENFYEKDCKGVGMVKLLYRNRLAQLYVRLVFRYLHEKLINLRLWSQVFDAMYCIYKKTLRRIIKRNR